MWPLIRALKLGNSHLAEKISSHQSQGLKNGKSNALKGGVYWSFESQNN